MKPMMSDEDIEAIDNLLDKLKPETCLEWGSGNSTLYFPQHKSIKKWVSIENSPRWYKHVGTFMNKGRVELIFKTWEDYLNVGGKYDFILIDGVQRNECLRKAQELLNDNGVVLLHDTARSDCNEGMSLYKKREVLTKGEVFIKGAKNGLTELWK